MKYIIKNTSHNYGYVAVVTLDYGFKSNTYDSSILFSLKEVIFNHSINKASNDKDPNDPLKYQILPYEI